MTERPGDQAARDRFTSDWSTNLAVVANAGSGKTTAISRRLAAMALAEDGGKRLGSTAVVTYTRKAATQIGQRARAVLLEGMAAQGMGGTEPLERLDRAYFGTIHSFCILLARRHGSTLGVHLNPTLVEDDDESYWEEFLEQDPMRFSMLGAAPLAAFLRHAPLDDIFELAKELDAQRARWLGARVIAAAPPAPSAEALGRILSATPARRGKGADALARNQEAAAQWVRRFHAESGGLPIAEAQGKAGGIVGLYAALFAPLKQWLADAGGVLAAELSLRYRAWRNDRGIQTYADQVETALAVLGNHVMLEQIRAEGWRVILDEAQDTDPKQFGVLVEIARPPGAPLGTWPGPGPGPRPGHFCMVGDAQQGIYSTRAEVQNFQRHLRSLTRADGGEQLTFDVTFRTPRSIVGFLNATLPGAFGSAREHNMGLPPSEGAAAPLLQVEYKPLVPGPSNALGAVWRLPIEAAAVTGTKKVADQMLAGEARQIAARLVAGGPGAVGARAWGDICVVAPRNGWLEIVRDEFEAAGLKTALQMRRNRSGDNPAYAWLAGLMAVVCDPENAFEWVGVLREVFGVSDPEIAAAVRAEGGLRWEDAGSHPGPVGAALDVVRPFVDRADEEGGSLEDFAIGLCAACRLGEKARMVDPEGGLSDELDRLVARAATLGTEGGGPRAWLDDLLGSLDEFRSAGRPASDALNLISAHSAKGLEWPVVILVGLWREIRFREKTGIRIVGGGDGASRVIFDNEGLGADTSESMRRERERELVRLLYVSLTRTQEALVIPWPSGTHPKNVSFASLWGLDPLSLDPLPEGASTPGAPALQPPRADFSEPVWAAVPPGAPADGFPARILPHQLARKPDLARAQVHESALDEPLPVKEDATDPLDYGTWWHRTLEFLPWEGDDAAVAAYGAASVARADVQGFGERGAREWHLLLASEPWRLMRAPRWSRLAEVGIFAPLGTQGWIDGVIDLVLHDRESGETWIVDWKTNRRAAFEDNPALLRRLASEYERQLSAYGDCTREFFPESQVRLWVYSTFAGDWLESGSPS